MLTFRTTESLNLFGSFQTGLKSGQKSTISNLALTVSQNVQRSIQASTQDAFLRTASKNMQLAANKFSGLTNLAGQPLQTHAQTLTITDANNGVRSGNAPFTLTPEFSPDVRELRAAGSAGGDARFAVDASVDGQSSDQTAINLRQAAQVKRQMGLGAENGSLESLARDLAVFGLDFTALNESPEALVETIRQRSLDMLDRVAAEGGSVAERNRITGASSRLVNGVQSSAGVFFSVDSSNDVTVDGTVINGKAAFVVGSVVEDPLVLDLGGDGIHLSSAEDGVSFDMDGDGVRSRMGFIRGDDALLFRDTHGDGIVHDGTQLFGNTDGHANGFEKLRSYDDNGDGVIDKNDAVWDSLRVWVEKTEDGVSDVDETMTLEEAGIRSINVGYEDVREDDGQGNLLGQLGSYQRVDGSAGLAADAWFQSLGPAE